MKVHSYARYMNLNRNVLKKYEEAQNFDFWKKTIVQINLISNVL